VEQADAEADSLSVLYVCVCQGPCLCCVCASVSGSLSVLFFRVCVTESFCVPSYLYNADMLSYHKSYFYLILYHVFCIIIYVVTAHYIGTPVPVYNTLYHVSSQAEVSRFESALLNTVQTADNTPAVGNTASGIKVREPLEGDSDEDI
jgi:hypothetical protein